MKKVFVGLFAMLVFMAMSIVASGQTTEVKEVSGYNLQGWGMVNEGNALYSSGTFLSGPAGVPMGTGSASLNTTGSLGSHILGTGQYSGTKLSDILALKYYSIGNLSPQAVALQFDVDNDLSDTNIAYQGRLVFEPYQAYGNSAVIPGQWTEWDALNGAWWGTPGSGVRPLATACPQSTPCTTAQVLAMFPNIGIRAPGNLLFKAGSGWMSAFNGNVDKFTVTINTPDGVETIIWDFEDFSDATDMEQCKKGGYRLFNPAGGAYSNQGQCVTSTVPQ